MSNVWGLWQVQIQELTAPSSQAQPMQPHVSEWCCPLRPSLTQVLQMGCKLWIFLSLSRHIKANLWVIHTPIKRLQ